MVSGLLAYSSLRIVPCGEGTAIVAPLLGSMTGNLCEEPGLQISLWIRQAPQAHALFAGSAERETIVVCEEGDSEWLGVSEKGVEGVAGIRVPEPHGFIKSSREDSLTVCGKGDIVNPLRMPP